MLSSKDLNATGRLFKNPCIADSASNAVPETNKDPFWSDTQFDSNPLDELVLIKF